jgi:hypothetical protein
LEFLFQGDLSLSRRLGGSQAEKFDFRIVQRKPFEGVSATD